MASFAKYLTLCVLVICLTGSAMASVATGGAKMLAKYPAHAFGPLSKFLQEQLGHDFKAPLLILDVVGPLTHGCFFLITALVIIILLSICCCAQCCCSCCSSNSHPYKLWDIRWARFISIFVALLLIASAVLATVYGLQLSNHIGRGTRTVYQTLNPPIDRLNSAIPVIESVAARNGYTIPVPEIASSIAAAKTVMLRMENQQSDVILVSRIIILIPFALLGTLALSYLIRAFTGSRYCIITLLLFGTVVAVLLAIYLLPITFVTLFTAEECGTDIRAKIVGYVPVGGCDLAHFKYYMFDTLLPATCPNRFVQWNAQISTLRDKLIASGKTDDAALLASIQPNIEFMYKSTVTSVGYADLEQNYCVNITGDVTTLWICLIVFFVSWIFAVWWGLLSLWRLEPANAFDKVVSGHDSLSVKHYQRWELSNVAMNDSAYVDPINGSTPIVSINTPVNSFLPSNQATVWIIGPISFLLLLGLVAFLVIVMVLGSRTTFIPTPETLF